MTLYIPSIYLISRYGTVFRVPYKIHMYDIYANTSTFRYLHFRYGTVFKSRTSYRLLYMNEKKTGSHARSVRAVEISYSRRKIGLQPMLNSPTHHR